MVDPASTPLGKMLLEEITPVVMVLSTPLAEESCLKNGFSFIQMLAPFCNFNNIDVPVRTASDQPYRLQKFKLRLFYASDVRQPNMEVAKRHLKNVITQGGEEHFSELSSNAPQSSDIHASSGPDNIPSWFQFFNKDLIRMVSFSDHEAFDHPVACLLVVSSKDEQPVNRFVDLFNTNKLPSLLNNGAMDPKIMKYYLLLHDNQDGPPDRETKILADMRSMFGSSDCLLLHINSAHDEPVQHQQNPWASACLVQNSDTSISDSFGSLLSADDIIEIKDLTHEFSSKYIIPNMEQKIRALNQQVSATRKGLRNQIKNLWWRKGKEDAADSNGPMYTFNSIESQIRVLGDYAFMLRDYELALSSYRLISTDYKLDKAWKRYAGVQEVMGLTYFMSDQSKKEAEYCMENAFNTYLKLGSSGQQNATRCGLWWVEMLKARDEYKEAATVYFRICGEDLLHSAVMLEQASYCYFLSKPSMLRKYGFHLVLSGDYYKKCDQIKHAIRAYRSAVSVFKGTTWNHIRDHVHFHIGQWYALLGMFDVAVKHMLEILACSHQSKAKQELFLSHSLQIVERTGKTFEVLKLLLPGINISSLKVISEDHRTYASPTAASTRESVWCSLEEEMIPSFSTARTNWLELHSKLISKKPRESNICVAGESVKVDIEFRNPLQIPIFVTGVSLICKLAPKSNETAASDETKSNKDNEKQDECENSSTNRDAFPDYSSFILSEVDFSLGGGETTMVQLTVTPIIEGMLQIVGVKWKLSGSLVGIYNFEPNHAKKSITNGRRKPKYSPGDNLNFTVIKNLPKLQGSILHFPERLYAGHIQKLVLELRNQSDCPIKNLKMKISNSRLLTVGDRHSLNSEFPACLEKAVSEKTSAHTDAGNSAQAAFLFPEGTAIQGETTFLWPLWLRAAVPGKISLYVSIYYEMGDTSSIIKYRTLRVQYDLQILPSLDVSFHICPSPLRLREFLVRMDVVNRTSSESFVVHQLSSFGQQWEISLLQPPESIFPSKYLMAGQALSCFFMLKDHMDLVTSEDMTSASSPLLASDVRLVPHGSQDPLYDINRSPLIEFHNHERMLQESSDQGDQSTVDFMLISQPLESETNPEISDPPHLFSYHACHCSTASTGPISWLVEGPGTLHHNFSVTFCEVKLSMTLNNSSDAIASIQIKTSDSSSISLTSSSNIVQSGTPNNRVGWHDISPESDVKVTSNAMGTELPKSLPLDSVSPYIWSGSSSTNVQIEPMSSKEIPLQICVFHPGTYDLSNYSLHWNLIPSNDEGTCESARQSSGTRRGYPYYLTVLQTD